MRQAKEPVSNSVLRSFPSLVKRSDEMKRRRNRLQWHAKSSEDLCRKQAYKKMMHSVPMSELPAYAGLTAFQGGKEDRG